MNPPRDHLLSIALLGFLLIVVPSAAQQPPCSVPSYAMPANQPNIFSEEQENFLGEAAAENMQRNFRVIDDDVTEYLRRVGQRLLAQIPPSQIRFQFYLFDVPTVNAFGLPGGRIYVSRKLVAASRSEDELAGVVAHEIGHIITRQLAIRFTSLMQKVLGVTSVSGREDILEKFHQFLENAARNPKAFKGGDREAEDEQLIADRVALYLLKRAGYDPDAYGQFWDRAFEVGGKTGGFFSDFFGLTKPEQKRLREMRRLAATLPAACAGARPESTAEQYAAWKEAVVAYSGLGRRESLRAVTWRRSLSPQLRGYISHLKFSRDGKYVLAQDAGSIFVLSREPFEVLFRVDALDAFPAQFSPDSHSIVFYTNTFRVEVWNIADERRTSLQEMTVHASCIQARLSPDGEHLACYETNYSLTMFEVATGKRMFQKKEFYLPSIFDYLNILLVNWDSPEADTSPYEFLRMEFSPDGRYFLAGHDRDNYFAYDFTIGTTMKLPDSIRKVVRRSFMFMEGDRIVGVNPLKTEESAVMTFPQGEVQKTFNPGAGRVTPATRGNYLLVRPIAKYPVGILDLDAQKISMANRQAAFDLYDKFYVSERTDGVLFLFHADKEAAVGQAILPQSPLPRLRAVAVSPDMNWLAVSERSRGAIWDLRKGERAMLTRSFRGAQFSDDGILYADFPKHENEERMIARVSPLLRHVTPSASLKDSKAHQDGSYLVELRPAPSNPAKNSKESKDPMLVVSSATTGQQLWSRAYPKGLPSEFFNPDEDLAVLVWSASSDFVKEESKSDAALKSRMDSKKEREGDYYLHVVEAKSGKILGKLYVETGRGSFRVRSAFAAGDYVTVYDNANRLLVYSVSTGKQIGRIFGASGDVSPAAQLLAAENERGVVTFYALPSLEKRGSLIFSSPISYARFSKDGKQLFVLTANQQAFLFDTAAAATPAISLPAK
ncbi:MAG TPA: M48 family metalloprotease [Candidatus Nitrosotenuis sp.]|nr:M48 family metalloprotease [Candidatus Nitrosotenuis sp.]